MAHGRPASVAQMVFPEVPQGSAKGVCSNMQQTAALSLPHLSPPPPHQMVPGERECDFRHPATGALRAGHQAVLHSEEIQGGFTEGHNSGYEERLRDEGTEKDMGQIPKTAVAGAGGGGRSSAANCGGAERGRKRRRRKKGREREPQQSGTIRERRDTSSGKRHRRGGKTITNTQGGLTRKRGSGRGRREASHISKGKGNRGGRRSEHNRGITRIGARGGPQSNGARQAEGTRERKQRPEHT